MAVTLNDLGKTLLAQLYENVTGGDGSVPPAEDAFISWAQPGIPFGLNDFQFAVQGLSANIPQTGGSTSSASTPAAAGSPSGSSSGSNGSSASSGSATSTSSGGGTATAAPPAVDPADELRLMLQQAFNFADRRLRPRRDRRLQS